MTNPLDNPARTADHALADRRVDALKAQLAMVQAERALLHASAGQSPSESPSRPWHGLGGWLFAGLSACVLAGTIMVGVSRPPRVVERVVHVEVPVEVERPTAEATHETAETPEVAVAPDPEPEMPRVRRPARPRGSHTTSNSTGMRVDAAMLNIDGCGNDPICGAR